MKTLARIVLSGFGTGYLPIAPGTWGSAAVLAIYLLAAWLGADRLMLLGIMVAVTVLASLGCVAFGRIGEHMWGRKDPKQCSADEWAGQGVALLWMPLLPREGFVGLAVVAVGAFLAFRVMDILKPPPARWVERWPYGVGVLTDDLIAGGYANLVVRVLVLVFAPAG